MKTPGRIMLSAAVAAIVHLSLFQGLWFALCGIDALSYGWPFARYVQVVDGCLLCYLPALLTGMVVARLKGSFRPAVAAPLGVIAFWVVLLSIGALTDWPVALWTGGQSSFVPWPMNYWTAAHNFASFFVLLSSGLAAQLGAEGNLKRTSTMLRSLAAASLGRWQGLATLAVLATFFVFGLLKASGSEGFDLGSAYLGSRLLAKGQPGELYRPDPAQFNRIQSPAWTEIGAESDVSKLPPPYVQTPLWATLLQPLSTRLTFPQFNALFLCVVVACLAASLWLTAFAWAPSFLNPWFMAPAALALWLSTPFQYLLFLTQYHVVFLLMAMGAVVLADRRRAWTAGALLAVAAAVKITPALLVLYWLAKRQWRCIAAFALFSAGLVAITLAVCGSQLWLAYLADLRRTSNVLLTAFNNQSLAATIGALRAASWEMLDFTVHPLPLGMKVVSVVLAAAAPFVGGLLDRSATRKPLGAALALLGITIFPPIAWSHYFVVLAVPAMILWDKTAERAWVRVVLAAVVVLNMPYLSVIPSPMPFISAVTIVRSHFYSGVVLIAALLWAVREKTHDGLCPST